MTEICSDLMFETRVTVDTALLERAAHLSPAVVVAAALSLLGLGLAINALPRGSRVWSLVGLGAPLVGLGVWHFVGVQTELTFPCVLQPAARAALLTGVCATIATLSLSQLVPVLTLRSWTKEPQALWPTVVLSAALLIGGAVGWQKRALQHDFEARVNEATPIPALSHPEEPLEGHLNQPIRFTNPVWAAGRETGWIFRERVLLPAGDRDRWGLLTLELTPTEEGVQTIPVHLERGLISIDDSVEVRGVRDEGPSWLPLSVGNRWEFLLVPGSDDFVEELRASLESTSKQLPRPSLVVEVTSEGVSDGFHFFEINFTTRDGNTPSKVRRLVRRNGELFEGDTRLAFKEDGLCVFTLLEPSSCTCSFDRLGHCFESGDVSSNEIWARLAAGVVTFGISEIMIWAAKSDKHEASVLLIRWVIDGKERSLRAP